MLEVRITYKKNEIQVNIFPVTAEIIEIEKERTLIWISEGYIKDSRKINKMTIDNDIKKIEFIF